MPLIELDDVVLAPRSTATQAVAGEALRLPRVSATLSARSLLGWQLRFEQLHVDGAALEVRRNSAGRLFVAGIELRAGPGEEGSAGTDWLLAQHEIAVRNGRLRWIDEQRAAPPLELVAVDLVLRNGLAGHELRLDATPPPPIGRRFTLKGEFRQPLLAQRSDWRRWSGTAFAELPQADAAALAPWLPALPVEVPQGEGALRAWVEVAAGEVKSVQADVALRQVQLRFPGRTAQALPLERLQGRVSAARDGRTLRFTAEQLSFASGNIDWPATRWNLTLRERAGARRAGGGRCFFGHCAVVRRRRVHGRPARHRRAGDAGRATAARPGREAAARRIVAERPSQRSCRALGRAARCAAQLHAESAGHGAVDRRRAGGRRQPPRPPRLAQRHARHRGQRQRRPRATRAEQGRADLSRPVRAPRGRVRPLRHQAGVAHRAAVRGCTIGDRRHRHRHAVCQRRRAGPAHQGGVAQRQRGRVSRAAGAFRGSSTWWRSSRAAALRRWRATCRWACPRARGVMSSARCATAVCPAPPSPSKATCSTFRSCPTRRPARRSRWCPAASSASLLAPKTSSWPMCRAPTASRRRGRRSRASPASC